MPQSSQTERQKQSLVAAHEVALRVITASPVPPTSVKAQCNPFSPGEPTVNVYFHDDPEGVRQLASTLGSDVTERVHRVDSAEIYIASSTEIDGVPVDAWTLIDPTSTGGAA